MASTASILNNGHTLEFSTNGMTSKGNGGQFFTKHLLKTICTELLERCRSFFLEIRLRYKISYQLPVLQLNCADVADQNLVTPRAVG